MSSCFLNHLKKYNRNIDWGVYYEEVYEIFKNDFLNKSKQLYFNSKEVRIKFQPKVDDKEQTFFHITSHDGQSASNRVYDYRRCERIQWVRQFIENYFCNNQKCNCTGIHNWVQPFKNTYRTYIWCESKRFVVILEERSKYYLLITAFYVNERNVKKVNELSSNCKKYINSEIK